MSLFVSRTHFRFPRSSRIERPTAGDYDLGAVLAPMNEFAGPATIAVKLLDNLLQRLGEFGTQQLMGHATDGFLAAIAIEFGRAFVPICNAVRAVANKDCVIAQVEQQSSFR